MAIVREKTGKKKSSKNAKEFWSNSITHEKNMKTPKIKIPKIKVKNSGIVEMKFYDDFPDGNLVIGEAKKNIPFQIKRVYYINNLFSKLAVRGKHAHKKLEQIIFCINGSFELILDDGTIKQKISMDNPYYGVRLGPRLWHTMSKFSSDCVILVLADDYFSRDYKTFLEYIKI